MILLMILFRRETISSLRSKLESHEYTERLVELYLKRIEVIDKDGPVLNSVLELNPDLYLC
jgi:amidase